MAMLVIKYCPHCKKTYDAGHNSRGIGIPLKKCPSCGGVIIDTDETEWELKNSFARLGYYFICAWTAFVYGISVPLAIDFFLDYYEYDINKLGWVGFGALYALGITIFAMILIRRNVKDIHASKERMKDENYRLVLRQAGLLKDE